MKFDTLVLGAGMVGVSVALHLQQRGRAVVLVDLKQPGNETSFGNAGLIQREGVYPYAFPRDFASLLHYARNEAPDVRYHAAALWRMAPMLWRYWYYSHPRRHAAIARQYATLIERCVDEHRALARQAGVVELLRPSGWIKVFRTASKYERELATVEHWRREFGVDYEALDAAQLKTAEPHLGTGLLGGIRYTGSDSTPDPHALVSGYAQYFKALGGRFLLGDARTLREGWQVQTEAGTIRAQSAVIAMGPWSDQITSQLGYRLPLWVKRGYHMHYDSAAPEPLRHPVLDAERGYLLAPMARGIRLTTGAELALRDAPATPVQLDAVEPVARALFPLGRRLDAQPWLGRRPCTPDMMPVIGPAWRHDDLWFAFGHAHHGLTLGPITGRLIAEMMTGQTPCVDVRPFRGERFNGA